MSHAKDFGAESGNEAIAEQLVYDYRTSDLTNELKALCDYAVKLTLAPGDMAQADIDKLRSHGWNDEQIHIATQVIGYFNYINRVADGLGVDNEDWMVTPMADWKRDKGRFDSMVEST